MAGFPAPPAGLVWGTYPPEAYAGGPIGLVEEGDMITLDIPSRKLSVDVSEEEMERRRGSFQLPGEQAEAL